MAVRPVPFFSGALFARKTCNVYLPPSYEEQSDRDYPVLYLLHGKFGSESDWLLKGNAEQTLDRMVSEGNLRECIVVMPNDGEYGHGTFYIDWYDGTGNFEQYILYDLIPYIDANFRTIRSPRYRVIGGLSMGGFGAFSLALRHPDLFGAAASLSGALGSVSRLPYREFSRSDYARMIGPLHGAYAQEHDLALLAARRKSEGRMPSLYFDCGKDDVLYEMNLMFRSHLQSIGYPHQFAEYPGAHTWEYWTEHLADALRFFEAYFASEANES